MIKMTEQMSNEFEGFFYSSLNHEDITNKGDYVKRQMSGGGGGFSRAIWRDDSMI